MDTNVHTKLIAAACLLAAGGFACGGGDDMGSTGSESGVCLEAVESLERSFSDDLTDWIEREGTERTFTLDEIQSHAELQAGLLQQIIDGYTGLCSDDPEEAIRLMCDDKPSVDDFYARQWHSDWCN